MIGVYFRHEEAIYFLYSFLSSAYAEVDRQKLHLICHIPNDGVKCHALIYCTVTQEPANDF